MSRFKRISLPRTHAIKPGKTSALAAVAKDDHPAKGQSGDTGPPSARRSPSMGYVRPNRVTDPGADDQTENQVNHRTTSTYTRQHLKLLGMIVCRCVQNMSIRRCERGLNASWPLYRRSGGTHANYLRQRAFSRAGPNCEGVPSFRRVLGRQRFDGCCGRGHRLLRADPLGSASVNEGPAKAGKPSIGRPSIGQ